MEERIHPTHKKKTNLISGILVGIFLSIFAICIFLDVREQDHWEATFSILIALSMVVFLSLIAWMFFTWMWCKCPECGRWLRIPGWNLPRVLKVECKRCDIRWNTRLEGPSSDT
jgi:hypothetical protein